MVVVYNMEIAQGSTFVRNFYIDHEPDVFNEWGDYTARMQLRSSIKSPKVILELTTENGGIELNPGRAVKIQISAADTTNLDFDQVVYDLETVGPTGIVNREVQGTIRLSREVTR